MKVCLKRIHNSLFKENPTLADICLPDITAKCAVLVAR